MFNPFLDDAKRMDLIAEEEKSPLEVLKSKPKVAPSDTPIPLPYFSNSQKMNDEAINCDEFELDDDRDGLFLADNA